MFDLNFLDSRIISNPSFNNNLPCDCEEFSKDLLMFCREMFTDTSTQQLQWGKFTNFLKHHIDKIEAKKSSSRIVTMMWKKIERLCHIRKDVNRIDAGKTCSQMLCIMILKKQHDFCAKLSTVLLHALNFIYQEKGHKNARVLGYLSINTNLYNTVIALGGKSEYTNLLVNFDLLSSLKDVNDKPEIEYGIFTSISNFMLRIKVSTNDFRTREVMRLVQEVYFTFLNCKNLKRLYLTIIAIQIAQFNPKKEESQEYISCLRMYFTTTQDPLITINEVRTVLYACLYGYSVQKIDQIFELFSENFLNAMPECSVKLKPRNLTDLSRCQIRENLKKCNLPFPAAVEKLHLPRSMKGFILGDVIQMSRNSRNYSQEQIITKSQLAELVIHTHRTLLKRMVDDSDYFHRDLEAIHFHLQYGPFDD